MPNIVIRIPAGVLDSTSKKRLVTRINAVAAEAEQIPDDPKNRFLCWVVIEETAVGNWTCGGTDVTASMVPVLIIVHLPACVLDEAARSRYAAGMHEAVASALPDEKRRILSSCVFNEVDDGHWGVNGALWHLSDFAQHAGFRHLQHLVDTPAASAHR